MEDWADNLIPPPLPKDLDKFESALVSAIHQAATQASPPTSPSSHTHKNHWYYNDRIKELRHRLLIIRKAL